MTQASQSSFLIGLIGAGIGASLTPAMHEREAAALGLRYVYKKIDLEVLGLGVDSLPDLLTAAERLGFDGLNVTHPCKQTVVPLLTDLSLDARELDAVNTIVLRDGKRSGHNTDWYGFAEAFNRNLSDAKRRSVVLLGAGGAGSAVGHAALKVGVERLTIFDIQTARAVRLADSLSGRFGEGRAEAGVNLSRASAEADGLIHATPTGMRTHPGLPFPAELLRPQMWIAELVYFPFETELLRLARSRGARTMDGGGMAVFQAVEAFRLFTGQEPDPERMLSHFASMAG